VPLFILLTKLSGACKDRLRGQPEILDEICGKLEACEAGNLPQYATLGEYNFVNVIDLKDEKMVYGLALELNSIDGVETVVLPALPMEEYKKIIQKMKK
jgi:uncharacterized protein with GYD domain